MYEAYWQLQQKPFEPGYLPEFFFAGESHQAALLKLRYAIENRRGGALLTGAAGVGKTLVATMLRELLGEACRPLVHVVFPQMSAGELLAFLAAELTGDQAAPAGVHESVRRIQNFLGENARQGRHAVLIVDEAHLLDDPPTLEALRLLMNFEVDQHPAATLLLTGQTAILPILQRSPQLDERLAVKCMLRPFTPRETAEYVACRLQAAGATQPIFSADALNTLHVLSHGIARRINRIADLALLIGFAEEHRTIGANQLEAVADELTTVVPE